MSYSLSRKPDPPVTHSSPLSTWLSRLFFFSLYAVARVCGVRQNLYVYGLYLNPDLDERIFDCLASMVAVQAEDVRVAILFLGNLNGHHQEWLGSTTTSRHGVAAFDFATVSGCDQLVVGPTHVRGGTLDLLMTDVSDFVRAAA